MIIIYFIFNMNQAINENHRLYAIYCDTNQISITLASFKNIDIWLSYCPNKARMSIFDISIWAYVFWPIGLKVFNGSQENIIYRLVMRNPSYYAYFSFLVFWPLLAGKCEMCVKCHRNVGPLGGSFGPTAIS